MTRLIPFSTYNPYVKNALNHVAMTTVADTQEPIMWLSGWSKPTVNIGRDKQISDVCNAENVREDNVCIVRRQGGGGAVYLSPGCEISWSYVTPETQRADDHHAIYQSICTHIIQALEPLGVNASYEPVNDITVNGQKISGGTLRHANNVIYTGCTLLYDVNPGDMFTYLDPDEDKYTSNGYDDPRERVTSITDHADASFDDVTQQITDYLTATFNAEQSSWTDHELSLAEENADKYRDPSWLHR